MRESFSLRARPDLNMAFCFIEKAKKGKYLQFFDRAALEQGYYSITNYTNLMLQ
ncbi:MAG: hypothetical protein LBU66_00900 [Treponema sp.]|jgi:hypothetical protein|nr:hypothetical protein [Treponema sp.]